jgi:hypothetical protein
VKEGVCISNSSFQIAKSLALFVLFAGSKVRRATPY